ncbi:hypothetical protein GQ457_01G012130 [Hibiscus cannabinus]
MSQDLESMFKGLPHVSNIGLRVSGVEELNVGGGSGSQRADSKRARRVDDDLGENEFDSSDSESLVDERLVSDDDEEEITTLRDGVGEDDGNETDYLDSSDAGSYESDSDGEILFKKSSKVFFDTSSVEPRFEVGMIFESPQQFKEALYAYAVAQRDYLKKFHLTYQRWSTDFVLDISMQTGERNTKGGDLQLLFWAMCKATTEVEFQRHSSRMSKLKDKALRSLMTKDPKYWSKAYFSTMSKCDAVDNNFSEAFNSAIVPARFKSIISLFEDVRHYVMNRLVSNKLKCQNWKTELCPKICKKLEENKTSSAYCHVTWNGADGYEVFCKGDVFIVDIKGWKCTCRSWDLIGIPCPHVVCVILYRQERPEEYVIDSYKTSTYCSLYNSALPSIPSEKFWNDTRMGPIDPPLKRKLPGRPKHKRKKEEGEQANGKKLSKRGVKMSCRLCGQFGHNIRTCPKKKKSDALNDVTEIEPITLNSYTQEQHTTETFNQATTTLVSQPPRTNVTVSRTAPLGALRSSPAHPMGPHRPTRSSSTPPAPTVRPRGPHTATNLPGPKRQPVRPSVQSWACTMSSILARHLVFKKLPQPIWQGNHQVNFDLFDFFPCLL